MGALLRTRPGLRRLWRDVGRVQLGEDPGHAVVLDGLGPGEEAVLDDLAEGVEPSELGARCRGRGARGASPEAVEHLLSLLRAADALEPPPGAVGRSLSRAGPAGAEALGLVHGGSGWDVLARRAGARVRVEGCSRTATAVAAGLVEAGVGAVDLVVGEQVRVGPEHVGIGGLTVQDVGRPADAATARLLEGWARERHGRVPLRAAGTTAARRTDLVVLVVRGAVPPRRGDALVRDDVPHLAVVLRVRTAEVGPLVVPGTGACLRCVDLRRGDLDPEWPRVAAQLAHPLDRLPGRTGEDLVLARLASALAVGRVLARLDALPADPALPERGRRTLAGHEAAGLAWEVDVRDGLPRGRRWAPHPRCGCTAPPS